MIHVLHFSSVEEIRIQYAVFRLRKAPVKRNSLLVNSLLLGTKVKMFSNVFAVVTTSNSDQTSGGTFEEYDYDTEQYILMPDSRSVEIYIRTKDARVKVFETTKFCHSKK